MTPRQIKLLHAIIDEFVESASAVGSVSLVDKHRLGVSPATIRNEMSDLAEQGYLQKPHTSSGRIPTNLAYRFFIDQILQDLEDLDIKASSQVYEKLYQLRFDFDSLVNQALEILSKEAQNTAFVLIGARMYYSGLAYIPQKPEFREDNQIINILNLLEDKPYMQKILSVSKSSKPVKILFGDDANLDGLQNCAIVFSEIELNAGKKGYIGIFGPNRMEYTKIIPLVNFFKESLNEVVSGW